MKHTLTFAAALAFGAAALMPMSSTAQTGLNVFITSEPPAPRYETIPAQRSGYVWAPGFWNWENNRHVWVAGRWEAQRNGYQYQRSEWARDNNGWRLNRGGWQQVAAQQQGDYNMIRVAPPRFRRQPLFSRAHSGR